MKSAPPSCRHREATDIEDPTPRHAKFPPSAQLRRQFRQAQLEDAGGGVGCAVIDAEALPVGNDGRPKDDVRYESLAIVNRLQTR